MTNTLHIIFNQIKEKLQSDEFIYKPANTGNADIDVKTLIVDSLNEAYQIITIIGEYLDTCKPDVSILEIGTGMGIAAACLKKAGFDVHAIEPHTAGFENCSLLYQRVYSILDIGDIVLPVTIEQMPLNKQYDFIFSFNVLEHVNNIEAAFRVLSNILKPAGVMVHSCPNYSIPYEPHCNVLLLPFVPQYTHYVCRRLRNAVGLSLTFTTVGLIKKLAEGNNLAVPFKNDVLYNTFRRFEYDAAFAQRQKGLPLLLYTVLKRCGLLWLTKHVPVAMQTPMVFTLHKKIGYGIYTGSGGYKRGGLSPL
jgi:2-polyprenyl-3-methyl-5-hydroxy-6-metoxy-1,4-benzoquinol methylase